MEQTSFDFSAELISPLEDRAVWTPRDIWVRINQNLLEVFREDRRVERKDYKSPNLDELAIYLSMFSNVPDGGVLIYGITNSGEIVGCGFSTKQLNSIERCHITHVPKARPEFKRVSVVVNGKPAICIAIYIPYIGQLVETNKDEAWIRYGESRHRMSDEEKRDFRSTRQELSFELSIASAYQYPADFDLKIVQDFCDEYRSRESKSDWSNVDILIDRHLMRKIDGKPKPLNSLVLMAANDPALMIPGCRVRLQRFSGTTEGSGESYSPLRDRAIEGNLVSILQKSKEIISSEIFDVTWLNDEGKFITTPEYPQWAWFEALVNACVHRSYHFSGTEISIKLFSDRMEIESPGGFVPPVNEKTIYEMRASRNHHLMDALRYLGYVRMSREGTKRIRDSMEEYRLPAPTFRQEALHGVVVRVTLRNDQGARKRASDRDVVLHFGVDVWKELTEDEIKIVGYAYRNGQIQVSEAQRLTGRTWKSSKNDLGKLVARSVLVFHAGAYPRDPKATYRLAPSEIDHSQTSGSDAP